MQTNGLASAAVAACSSGTKYAILQSSRNAYRNWIFDHVSRDDHGDVIREFGIWADPGALLEAVSDILNGGSGHHFEQ